MVRSLLRASQLRDEDVMEEAEHDAWVHVDLVTSGTLNFQDGTISGTGSIYADTLYSSGEAIYTQSEVNALIATVSGSLQAQIDNLGALLI